MTSPLPPVLSELADKSRCHGSYGLPRAILSPGPSRTTLAPGCAFDADGRALLLSHVMSSAVTLSADPKISTRGFHCGGNFFQKTGK